jgi:hypothetical protein
MSASDCREPDLSSRPQTRRLRTSPIAA